jgi:hypothetical protein
MMKHTTTCAVVLLAAAAIAAPAQTQDYTEVTATTTTVTNATGTISQVTYNGDGTVGGFLLGANILLTFPPNVAGGVGSLGAAGNSVTYSGAAPTNSAGFQLVLVSSFTNNTTKASYTSSTTPATTAYGPTSGSIKLLNYDLSGAVDGFVFAPSGSSTTILVETGPVASTALKAALTVGASVSVTGTTFTAVNMCTVTGALTVVDASTLVLGGTTYVITGGGGFGPGPGGQRGGRH